ncbi:MAG: hypothetical protein WCA44_05870 [Acidobacteriaceae bacterium]
MGEGKRPSFFETGAAQCGLAVLTTFIAVYMAVNSDWWGFAIEGLAVSMFVSAAWYRAVTYRDRKQPPIVAQKEAGK